ncbi:hypothetical protein WJX82_000777 [Trebouxia sp. C0006]
MRVQEQHASWQSSGRPSQTRHVCLLRLSPATVLHPTARQRLRSPNWKRPLLHKRTQHMATASQQSAAADASVATSKRTAKDVVQEFYTRYNKGDVDGIMELFADDCEYHDMIYADPFTGKEQIRAFFAKFSSTISKDLQFVVDGISGGDPNNTGVKWHLELNGEDFPYSRGLSFYEVNDDGKITSARDIPEPTIKPGDSAIYAIKALTPLVRKLGPKANPANLKLLPPAAIAAWAFYIGYIGIVLFGTSLPGKPAYAVEWRTLVEVWHCSVNFFYINQILNWLGVHLIQSAAEHPVNEALFNLVNVWSLMLWPLMLADKKGAKVKNKFGIYLGTQFLTNIFFVPYLALREQPAGSRGTRADADPKAAKLPGYAPIIGITGAAIGLGSIVWALSIRPEYGGLAERWQYFVQQSVSNRVFFAFVLDAVLYYVWQALLMGEDATKTQRYIPFVGLISYLLQGGKTQKTLKGL